MIYGSFYFNLANAMPNISSSSSVILRRECVISSRIRPDAHPAARLRGWLVEKVILCHNHPSGDLTPPPEDIAVTQQLVAAGQHLDIELVDHLVIGNQRFVSLKER